MKTAQMNPITTKPTTNSSCNLKSISASFESNLQILVFIVLPSVNGKEVLDCTDLGIHRALEKASPIVALR
ncbi:MAG TPA: hypothetical protein VH814_18260 [Steroidobacteraceae bacterium]|jgi:hypothetical protein